MKNLKQTFLLVFVLGVFFSNQVISQTIVTKKVATSVVISGPAGTYELTGLENVRITPVGNYLRIVTFKLDKNHPMMVYLFENKLPNYLLAVKMYADIDGDGIAETAIIDTHAVLTKSGNLKFKYHSNGAGTNLPVGWDFY